MVRGRRRRREDYDGTSNQLIKTRERGKKNWMNEWSERPWGGRKRLNNNIYFLPMEVPTESILIVLTVDPLLIVIFLRSFSEIAGRGGRPRGEDIVVSRVEHGTSSSHNDICNSFLPFPSQFLIPYLLLPSHTQSLQSLADKSSGRLRRRFATINWYTIHR